ncbi:hypothetical protein KIL84_020165 [Mauremys mutica]|uniref:Uncharacterized protein n=1 Tax=Mauremys mutica TaxID=74926 RepID=A0A9D3XXU3_9SAUR|nr:hypothetical protein KIL84_020165 [Mauremys mutica]
MIICPSESCFILYLHWKSKIFFLKLIFLSEIDLLFIRELKYKLTMQQNAAQDESLDKQSKSRLTKMGRIMEAHNYLNRTKLNRDNLIMCKMHKRPVCQFENHTSS